MIIPHSKYPTNKLNLLTSILFEMDGFKNLFGVFMLQMMVLALFSLHAEGLKVGFYDESCPQAEAIVSKVMSNVIAVAPSLSGPLLRLHFHDCFIRVCNIIIFYIVTF